MRTQVLQTTFGRLQMRHLDPRHCSRPWVATGRSSHAVAGGSSTGTFSTDLTGVTTAYQVGYLRCFTGQTTNGTQCGEIEIASDDVTYDNYGGKVLTNQWVLDVGAGNAPIAGDSGGPVFRFDVPAAGSGWIYATGVVGAKRGNRYATGPKWNNIPAGWDVEVRTAP